MLYFYEIKCDCEYDEWYRYLYVTSRFALRSAKEATTNKIPEKARLLIEDRYLHPTQVRVMNAFEYLYCKYLKKRFHFGERLNWEKEKL